MTSAQDKIAARREHLLAGALTHEHIAAKGWSEAVALFDWACPHLAQHHDVVFLSNRGGNVLHARVIGAAGKRARGPGERAHWSPEGQVWVRCTRVLPRQPVVQIGAVSHLLIGNVYDVYGQRVEVTREMVSEFREWAHQGGQTFYHYAEYRLRSWLATKYERPDDVEVRVVREDGKAWFVFPRAAAVMAGLVTSWPSTGTVSAAPQPDREPAATLGDPIPLD